MIKKVSFFTFIIVFIILSLYKDNKIIKNQPVDEDLLKKKIGSLIIMGFDGVYAGKYSQVSEDIKSGLGGVILFDKNIINHKQLLALNNSLQRMSRNNLLISVDQEGGKVQRLNNKKGFITTPSALKISKIDIKKARKYYKSLAKELQKNSINLNFAPVVDMNIEPKNSVIVKAKRSYSKESKEINKYASIFIDEMQNHKIISVLKHFPGHGSSLDDSHKGFVDISKSWSFKELEPYYELINKERVNMIMSAHVYNSHFDNKYPSTLSYFTNTKILRQILKFKGVLISDDMQMSAISKEFSLKQSIKLALNSGVDMLLFANQVTRPLYFDDIVDIIYRLVLDKEVNIARVEEAYKRVKKLKKQL